MLLAGWTLFVWLGRVRNIAADRTLDRAGTVGAMVLPLLLVFGALALIVVLIRGSVDRARERVVTGVAVLTIGVWVVRGADIAFGGDHAAGFIVVHVVLASVSIGLAAWAWRVVRHHAARNSEHEIVEVG